jgi:hypothetical protein
VTPVQVGTTQGGPAAGPTNGAASACDASWAATIISFPRSRDCKAYNDAVAGGGNAAASVLHLASTDPGLHYHSGDWTGSLGYIPKDAERAAAKPTPQCCIARARTPSYRFLRTGLSRMRP